MSSKGANGHSHTNNHDLRSKLMQLNWLQHRFFAQQLSELGLTVPQYFVLSTLLDLGGRSSMGELSRKTHQVSATMTGIVDRLVRDGLVERVRGEQDRRLVIVEITPAGRELVEKAGKLAWESMGGVLETLSPREQEVAEKVIDSLVAEIELQESRA
ncbi:MAG: MarR family transcriptional regulator [Chloroflexi bacterium]|nr:MarR family transcriptional regulator [Chloroflexota bacterium]